jgi:glutamate dehydrogenase (NAD(P)+)
VVALAVGARVGDADAVADVFALMDGWGPEKVVCVSDGRTGMRGVLVLDNTARGMGKGGTRMSPTLTITEVARLARTMTWSWAAVDLFHGGAKAGILGDPNAENKEAVLRAFARALANEVPAEYVFGLDMGSPSVTPRSWPTSWATAAPPSCCRRRSAGSPMTSWASPASAWPRAADAAAMSLGTGLRGMRVAVQGFGAVGSAAVRRLAELGAVIVGVSTAEGCVHDPDGLDTEQLLNLPADCPTARSRPRSSSRKQPSEPTSNAS